MLVLSRKHYYNKMKREKDPHDGGKEKNFKKGIT